MDWPVFGEFLKSEDTLWVYDGAVRVFSSKKARLLALLEYIDGMASKHRGVIVLDKVMGNAAALLSVRAGCREVYSPLGSEAAVATLERYGTRYHLNQVVPYIQRDDRAGVCPMEKLSLGKTPEEFYVILKAQASP